MIKLDVTLVILRLMTAIIFACGAVALMYFEKSGWGWCVFASLCLGCVTCSDSKDD